MTQSSHHKKTGIWFIGALGSIAVTTVVGALSLQQGRITATGMVTESPLFSHLDLVPFDNLEFAGCDIRSGDLLTVASQTLKELGANYTPLLEGMEEKIHSINSQINTGFSLNCGQAIESLAEESPQAQQSQLEAVEVVRSSIRNFKTTAKINDVVVINLASTEPLLQFEKHHRDLKEFERHLATNNSTNMRASSLYTYAALQEGCPVINFTPSTGSLPPALIQLAEEKNIPVMGNDGKTGETLIKSALAPMFLSRNLNILSWEGFNILGNLDGKVLENPDNKSTKIQSKDNVLRNILGYQPHSQVHINYVPSLGDQKTAWDFIHFEGFMGAKMSLQFTWQAYDSLLAAPLVLDLARLAQLAKDRGEGGLMPHLASFFKSPLGTSVYDHHKQTEMLHTYAENTVSQKVS